MYKRHAENVYTALWTMYTQQGGGLCIHARRTMYTRTADYVYTARWTMCTQSWGLHMYIPNSGELCIYSTALDYVYTAPRRTMYTRHADNVYTALETMYTPIGVDYVCIHMMDNMHIHGTVDYKGGLCMFRPHGGRLCICTRHGRQCIHCTHW